MRNNNNSKQYVHTKQYNAIPILVELRSDVPMQILDTDIYVIRHTINRSIECIDTQ